MKSTHLPALIIACAALWAAPILAAQAVGSLKRNVNPAPYPHGNPVIRHMYTADAAPHVMPDGRVWMVTSVDSDEGGGYETMHRYHTFSSRDLVNWTDHGTIFRVEQVRPTDAPAVDKYALWAPDMVYRNGKYYLYYPVRILHSDRTNPNGGRVTTSYIGVAVSDHPAKPFTVITPRLEGTRGIDPAVFVDDDGQPYLYWGHHNVAKLAESMTELATKPVVMEIGTDIFMEASWMHKRAGRYYFNYHTKYNWQIKITKDNRTDPARAKSELGWSAGSSPLGPLVYGGTLNLEPGEGTSGGPRHPEGDFSPWRYTLSNHGGIVEFHGQDYLFYHTSALSSWRQDFFKAEGTWTQRSVCIDRIDYDAQGNPLLVKQTVEGVPAVKVDQPHEIKLLPAAATAGGGATLTGAVLATGDGGWLRFEQVALGTGYYYFDSALAAFTQPVQVEVRLGRPDGPLTGTATLSPADRAAGRGVAVTFLREARGRTDVYLVFRTGGPAAEVRFDSARFFAGAPL
jgi:hypothetical protein